MTHMHLEDDHYCFACGLENPYGLRTHWIIAGKTTSTTFIPDRKYQGWKGIVHGGILATLLDEAMIRLACFIYGSALTAEMKIRFVKTAEIGKRLDIRGEIIHDKRKIIEMRSTIHTSEILIAHATGKAIKM